MANQKATDGTGKEIRELPLGSGGFLRITKVPVGWTGGEALRFQIREVNNRLRQGPEVPNSLGPEVVRAIAELLMP
jgi:hypothetical protein